MGDEQQRRAAVDEELLHPLHRFHVEVIGGFVEQQDVGLGDQRAGQQRLALAATRGRRKRRIGVEGQVHEHRLHPRVHLPGVGRVERVVRAVEFAQRGVAVVGAEVVTDLVIARQQAAQFAESGGHHVVRGAVDVARNFLFEPRHRDSRLPHHLALVGKQRAVEQLHERALSRTVAPQQADAFAALDRKAGVIEHRRSAEGDGDVLDAQQCHVER